MITQTKLTDLPSYEIGLEVGIIKGVIKGREEGHETRKPYKSM